MTGLDARSFWIVGPGRGELRAEQLRPPSADEVVVRTLYSGISRGTETLVFSGAVPRSEFERMRAPFQAGAFPGPVKYGYSNVGLVEQGPGALGGRHVFCLYPHQTRYVVPAAALYVLPEGVPPERAVLAANLETAVNGAWDAELKIGDRVAVVGAGTVGCLAAWLAARAGCEVQLVDVDARKRDVADRLGVPFALAGAAAGDADVVVHATGTAQGLASALELAGFEATVVELSWYGDRRPEVPLGEAFHSRRLTLKSSQVGTIATAQRARWSPQRRMQLVLRLLRDATLDALISGESSFDELPAVLARLSSPSEYTLCHRIRYPRA
jgi:2-desacetyl-2-hydroxyethyl bacteriochlorophyllide A dehydrogenase